MGNGILFITGGDEVSRYVYETYGFAYWTSTFDILLEKHGFLDFNKSDPDVLESSQKVGKYGALLMSWLPESFWKRSYLNSFAEFQGFIFLEGPFPDYVDEFLRKRKIRKKFEEKSLQFVIQDNFTVNTLKQYFPDKVRETQIKKEISDIITTAFAAKKVDARITESEWRSSLRKRITTYKLQEPDSFQGTNLAHDAALLYNLNSKLKFRNNGFIFPKPLPNVLGTMAWLKCINSIQDDYFSSINTEHSKSMLEKISGDQFTIYDNQSFIECAALGIVNALASDYLQDSTYMDRAYQLYRLVSNYAHNHKLNLLQMLWQAYLICSLPAIFSDKYSELKKFLNNALKGIADPKTKLTSLIIWLLSSLYEVLVYHDEGLSNMVRGIAIKSVDSLIDVDSKRGILLSSSQLGVIELFQCVLALNKLSLRNKSLFILSKLFANCFDQDKATFKHAKLENGIFNVSQNSLVSPWIVLGLTEVVGEFDTIISNRSIVHDYSDRRLNAWQAPPYMVEPYECDIRNDPAYFWDRDTKTALSAISRHANIMTSSFQILSYLCHNCTIHPLKQPFNKVSNLGSALVLEVGFIIFLMREIVKNNETLIRVHNWPWGKAYCLTVRHDVDRQMTQDTLDRLLSFEVKHKLGVSWFWLPDKLKEEHINLLEKYGHEIGLHGLSHNRKAEELNKLRRILRNQEDIYGEFWHGGSGDNWVGHPSVHCAVEAGLLYTEGPREDSICMQYGLPAIDEMGIVYKEPIFIMPRSNIHVDLDLKYEAGAYNWINIFLQLGGHLILANHPDMNFDRFRKITNELPSDNRIDLTFLEACRWWNKTHRRDNLTIERCVRNADLNEYVFSSAEDIRNLELQLISDDITKNDFMSRCESHRFKPEYSISTFDGFRVARIRTDLEAGIPFILEVRNRREKKI